MLNVREKDELESFMFRPDQGLAEIQAVLRVLVRDKLRERHTIECPYYMTLTMGDCNCGGKHG